ncbi:lipoyl synthase [Buchnera aphidicola (Aphis craccivora)]|uniref:Lipoyl synthase n=1 Tax=Buchnera aphidicola (Aphis craccivora) TaxID=466616 RepID=A0A4D6XN03_9GAMM|nr:lipoyl synthase [Buchnera aphidicola]QCI16517.1 lipoyl synthase [Buchnera aphidicola (Aphis craccivora)]QLL40653.1 lipoyl synthase [Buchnera aphidicola (Aphis craccivore)]WAI18028.1 MAG: lipoyl synthase [Buchnera aphidicola (Aphis craccivora)]
MNKKINLIPIKNILVKKNKLNKPNWIKIKLPVNTSRINQVKYALRKNNLYSVCEEANCPNLSECFNNGTATFMILGDICTRNCPFCAVSHGKPKNLDLEEPKKLAKTIFDMRINYVVITSVVRDDLYDGGAQHFVNCMNSIRSKNKVKIEILVPDFRGRIELVLKIFNSELPDIFNHNIENVPRLYKKIRPGANYKKSLLLLESFKKKYNQVPTKSGLMVGIGEKDKEIIQVMKDLYSSGVTLLTVGQYLQPSKNHLPVERYISPLEFENIKKEAISIGFKNAYCGPFVRSSYHASIQN